MKRARSLIFAPWMLLLLFGCGTEKPTQKEVPTNGCVQNLLNELQAVKDESLGIRVGVSVRVKCETRYEELEASLQ